MRTMLRSTCPNAHHPTPTRLLWRYLCAVLLVAATAQQYARAQSADTRAATATTLTQIAAQASGALQFQAAVTAAAGGTPTGTVVLDQVTTAGSISLGSATLAEGVAVFSVAPPALSPTAILEAVYQGDADYLPSTSGNLPATGGTAGVSSDGTGLALTALSTAVPTVQPGGSATFRFSLTVVGGSTFTNAVDLSVAGLPQGATATFSPAAVAAGSAAKTVTLTVVAAASATATGATTAALLQPPLFSGIHTQQAFALPWFLVPFAPGWRHRRRRRWAAFLLPAVAACSLLTGCGVSVAPVEQQPVTYTFQVTAASGSATQTLPSSLIVAAAMQP